MLEGVIQPPSLGDLSPASMPAIPDSLRNSPALKLLTRTPKSFKCLQDKATGQLTWESKGPTPQCHFLPGSCLLGARLLQKNPCQYQTSTAVWSCVLTLASFGDCLEIMEPAIQEVEESFAFFLKPPKPVLKFLSRILSRLNKGKIPRIPPVFLGEFIQEVLQEFPHHQVHH